MTRTITTLALLVALLIVTGQSATNVCLQNQTVTNDCLDERINRRIAAKTPMPHGTYACEFGMVDVLCGGCVGGKLISQPEFCYPRVAKAARLSGFVNMKIVVDRRGKVVWAQAQNDAHLLLKKAATQMALQRRYEPFVCNGRPIKAVVYLSYKFGAS